MEPVLRASLLLRTWSIVFVEPAMAAPVVPEAKAVRVATVDRVGAAVPSR